MKVKITIDYVRYAVDEEDIPVLLSLLLKVKRFDTDYQTKTVSVKNLTVEVGHLDDNEQQAVYFPCQTPAT